MNVYRVCTLCLGVGLFSSVTMAAVSEASAVDQQLSAYQTEGAGPFSAEAGAALWQQPFTPKSGEASRSCTSCHGSDLQQPSKHQRTGKTIEPMSPAVNPARLSDSGKIEKWFKRNCKWTLGRLCTPQERGDLLLFIQSN